MVGGDGETVSEVAHCPSSLVLLVFRASLRCCVECFLAVFIPLFTLTS